MVKSGTSARSVVKVRLPATCGQRSSPQRRKTKARNPALSRRIGGGVSSGGYHSIGPPTLPATPWPTSSSSTTAPTVPCAPLAESVARGVESVQGMRARVRTVPRVAPVTEVAAPAVPPDGPPYVEPARPRGMRGPRDGLAHPLRQHGRADEAFPRHPRRRMDARHARGQARGGLHLDLDDARRPGNDAPHDDGAAAAPRHGDRGHPLSPSPTCSDHARRRHALRRLARGRRRRATCR